MLPGQREVYNHSLQNALTTSCLVMKIQTRIKILLQSMGCAVKCFRENMFTDEKKPKFNHFLKERKGNNPYCSREITHNLRWHKVVALAWTHHLILMVRESFTYLRCSPCLKVLGRRSIYLFLFLFLNRDGNLVKTNASICPINPLTSHLSLLQFPWVISLIYMTELN